jgi:hypothetical protein
VKRVFSILTASLLGFAALDLVVFHTNLYPYWVATSSSTGYVETVLDHERKREKKGSNQILGIGDSRMALVAKVANQLTQETSYQYGTIAVAGTTPRCWYYMLRAVDPDANRYKAIVIGIESYNDDEQLEDYAERESDLNYVIHQLGVGDLAEFSLSYRTPQRQWRAATGIAFKGLIYKRDFQDFLSHPKERVKSVRLSWRDSHLWFYDFRTDEKSLAGLTVNWPSRKLSVPPGTPPDIEAALRTRFVEPLPPETGRHSAYLKYWLGRIRDHYRNSRTQIVFARLPRAAWIRPDLPVNPRSSVHELDREPGIALLPEDLFNELETPERFHDQVHMNQGGLDRFTEILVREMKDVLEPISDAF